MHLALYCYHTGLVDASLKLMYRARYLGILCYGETHPDMATFDVSIHVVVVSVYLFCYCFDVSGYVVFVADAIRAFFFFFIVIFTETGE